MQVVWLVCWLVDWLVGRLVGWLAGWLVGWLVGWLAGWLAGWLLVGRWLVAVATSNPGDQAIQVPGLRYLGLGT